MQQAAWGPRRIDATYAKARQNGRIVSVAVIIAVGVNTDGRREVLGMSIGASEAETSWTEFLRQFARRGLRLRGLPTAFPSGIGSKASWPSMVSSW
jgi:transposase-like protein